MNAVTVITYGTNYSCFAWLDCKAAYFACRRNWLGVAPVISRLQFGTELYGRP